MGIYFNLSFWYKLIDQTWWGAVFSAIGCAVLLAINFIFVPKFGYNACAWGGFAGYGVCMVLSYVVGQKKAPIPYNLKPIAGYFVLAVALFSVSKYLVNFDSVLLTLLINTLLLLIYCAVIIFAERTLVKSTFSAVKRKILKK